MQEEDPLFEWPPQARHEFAERSFVLKSPLLCSSVPAIFYMVMHEDDEAAESYGRLHATEVVEEVLGK